MAHKRPLWRRVWETVETIAKVVGVIAFAVFLLVVGLASPPLGMIILLVLVFAFNA